ncbi:MAG TPA: guanylate kinase [Bellilinea sp.]|nr:guanylate kinase [Bellilinea sp.]
MSQKTTLIQEDLFRPLVILLSGPSGVGKDAVIKTMQQMEFPFHFVVTTTDRPKRKGEVDGVDYNFISPDEFQRMVRDGEFIECAKVYDHYKGVPRKQIEGALATGKDVILRLDVQGAARVRELFPDSVQIFLIPENEEQWERRFRLRGTEDEELLQLRMKIAHDELCHLHDFDYLVVNATDCLDETVRNIIAIIRAEHLRLRPLR